MFEGFEKLYSRGQMVSLAYEIKDRIIVKKEMGKSICGRGNGEAVTSVITGTSGNAAWSCVFCGTAVCHQALRIVLHGYQDIFDALVAGVGAESQCLCTYSFQFCREILGCIA